MKYSSFLSNFNKNLIILILCLTLSIALFFSKDSSHIKNFKLHFSNFIAFFLTPKTIALELSTLRFENDSLITKIDYLLEKNMVLTI